MLAMLLCRTGILVAQPERLYFHHLTPNEGLSQSLNEFILKDRQGFVWISSTDGLNRFDGQAVRVYRPEPGKRNSMVGNYVVSPFFEDGQGNIWFGTMQAINCWRRATDDFSSFTISVDNRPWDKYYYIFHRDGLGQLWTLAGNRLFLFAPPDPDSALARPVQKDMGTLKGYFNFVLADNSKMPKRIFSSNNDDTLYVYDCIGGKVYEGPAWAVKNNKGQRCIVRSLLTETLSRRLWVTSDRGLLLLDAESGIVLKSFDTFEGENFGSASAIEPMGAGHIFVSTHIGLLLFDVTQEKFVRCYRHGDNDPGSQTANLVHNLYLDHTRTLWASFWAVGVDYAQLDKQKFPLIQSEKLLVGTESNFSADALAMDIEGNLWVGSNMASLRKRKGNKGKPVAVRPNGNLHRTSLIKNLDNGDLLFTSGQGDGAFWYDMRREKFFEIKNGKNELTFNDFCQIPSAETTILAGSDKGLYRLLRKEDGSVLPEKTRVSNLAALDFANIQKIFLDKEGRVYLSANSRSLVAGRFQNEQFAAGVETPLSGLVNSFAEYGDYLWAGGEFGLYRFRKQDFDQGKTVQPDTVFSSTVYGLLPGDDNCLWLSTNTGLFCLRSDTAALRGFSLRQYHLADGLQGFEYNSNAYQKAPDGRFWFGGISGINHFRPIEVHDLDTLPQVWITGLWVNDKPDTLHKGNVTLLNDLTFNYDQSTLSFEFVALEFSDPDRNRLKYCLKKIGSHSQDTNWVFINDAKGFVRFATLEPGKYKFQVMGANSDGHWNPSPRTIQFTITPPFTQTPLFYALCVIALLGIGLVSTRLYIRNRLRVKNLQLREQHLQIEKQEALTQERNRIAGEMHDDLGGGLTSIRMLSSRVQKKINNPEIQTQVDKIAQYSQELVQKMGEIIWAMNSNFDTLDNLIAYIRSYAVRYLDENNIRCIVQRPDEVPDINISGERRRNLYLAVKESLHNIVKHAEAERVNMHFILNGELEVRVQDNGKGIDPEQINQFGNGLYNMRKRLESIGGSMEIQSHEGTLLIFSIPLKPD